MKTRLSPILTESSRKLRKRSTNAERLLWKHLRNEQLGGLKFRRQEPIGNYIADFACIERFLVVELDGEYHEDEEQKVKDARRTEYLNRLGFRVIRFSNEEVFGKIVDVLESIQKACEQK